MNISPNPKTENEKTILKRSPLCFFFLSRICLSWFTALFKGALSSFPHLKCFTAKKKSLIMLLKNVSNYVHAYEMKLYQ